MSKIDGIYLGFSNKCAEWERTYMDALQLLAREYIIRFNTNILNLDGDICVVSDNQAWFIDQVQFAYNNEKGKYDILLQDELMSLKIEYIDYLPTGIINELYEKIKEYDNKAAKNGMEE